MLDKCKPHRRQSNTLILHCCWCTAALLSVANLGIPWEILGEGDLTMRLGTGILEGDGGYGSASELLVVVLVALVVDVRWARSSTGLGNKDGLTAHVSLDSDVPLHSLSGVGCSGVASAALSLTEGKLSDWPRSIRLATFLTPEV